VASGAGWERLGRIELIAAAIEVLAWKEDLPTRRAKKKIRLLFEDKKWLGQVLEGLPAEQRVGLFAKVQKAAGWDASGKRSAMAAMIRLDPELAKVAASAEAEPETRPGTHFTSWRSYRERQEKLRILSEKTIPENSREIATARSYGDLSENFEYHAAKDRQRLLLKRRGELETDLEGIKGTDFSGMPTDKAGMGTCVTLQRPDGRSERYCILGEWDRDEALNIISYKSKIAECLEGRTAGEQVALPGPSGVEVCRITEVGGLTADVRNWIAGDATVTDAAAE
jgi:transcription elongation GreA/GreB family factor